MSGVAQTCIFLNRGLMGIASFSDESDFIDIVELRKLNWRWLETQSSPADVPAGNVMAWMQPLSRGATMVAKLVRSAPSESAARWSIHAIVLNSDSYAWLIDRLATCIADDDFWSHSAFSDGEPVELPPWDSSSPLPPSGLVPLRAAIARVKEEGIARIDRTQECEPWEFVLRAPSSLRGEDRVRLRWLVGFDHFPRGTHIVSGRFAAADGPIKTRIPMTAPKKAPIHVGNPMPGSTVVVPIDPPYKDFPAWKAKIDRQGRIRFLVPAACMLVIVGAVAFAFIRLRATGGS